MPKCFCGNEMTRKDWKHQWVCHKCGRTKPLYESMTNADRIRSMSDEELAEFLEKTVRDMGDNMFKCENQSLEKCMDCKECYLVWLKSEVGCE